MRIHCLPPIISEQSHTLILGTMPGPKSLQQNAYYAHGGNRFWKLMGDLLQREMPEDYAARKEGLLQHGLALWDVLKTCDRIGAGDNAIRNEEANDLNSLLAAYPRIQRIIFNGDNPRHYFNQHVKLKQHVQLLQAKSTSPANNRHYPFEKLVEVWKPLLQQQATLADGYISSIKKNLA